MKTKLPKLQIRNTSQYSDEAVELCLRWALRSVCDVPGRLTSRVESAFVVKVQNAKWTFSGRASFRRVLLRIGSPSRFPNTHRYARYANNEDFPLLTVNDWAECLTGLAAHEFLHRHADGGGKPREFEFRCELAWEDAVDYLRKHRAEFDAELDAIRHKEAVRESAKRNSAAERAALLNSPEHKLHIGLEREKVFARKVKFYTTKLKKQQASNRRIQKRIQKVEAN